MALTKFLLWIFEMFNFYMFKVCLSVEIFNAPLYHIGNPKASLLLDCRAKWTCVLESVVPAEYIMDMLDVVAFIVILG